MLNISNYTIRNSDCEHDWEETNVVHETDARPVGYNYGTERIIEETWQYEVVDRKCLICGLIQECVEQECECEPDYPEDDHDTRYDSMMDAHMDRID